ncbi:MAG: winged helix-turn-helix transcriptional regulator [Halobacteriales archaeon]|nr:winged helix-turn-helix transcriptional regulator [Halobacteriales archaeon]
MDMRGVAQGNRRWGRHRALLLALVVGAMAAGSAHALGPVDAPSVNANADLGPASLAASDEGASLSAQGLDTGLPVEGIPPVSLHVPTSVAPSDAPAPALPLHLDSVGAWVPLAGGVLQQPAVQVGAGLSLVAMIALALRGLAFAPLYSRLDAQSLLDHPTRRELLRIIGAEPGVNISDLHGRLAMGWGSLLYHLQRLEAQGLVQSHRWGRSRRYFLNERSVSVRAAAIRALKAQNARALAEEIAQSPGATQEQLATTLGVSKSVVSKYAQRLEEVSLVERQVGRNCLRLFPKDELRELLHTLPPAAVPPPMHADPAPAGMPTVAGSPELPADGPTA